MGFTKKTWLALALAIVLVLGLSVSASASPTAISDLTATSAMIYTGTVNNSTTVTAALTGTAESGDSVTLSTNNSDVVTIANATQSPTAGTSVTWTVTAAKLGKATLTATYKTKAGASFSKTVSITVAPADLKSSTGTGTDGKPNPVYVKSAYKNTATASVTDTASTPNTVTTASVGSLTIEECDAGGTTTANSGLIAALVINPSTGSFQVMGVKPGTAYVKVTTTDPADDLVIPVVVQPDEIKIAAFDPADTDAWWMYAGTTDPTSKDYIVTDSVGNPVEGATLTSSSTAVATVAPVAPATTTSNGKFTVTGVAAGKVKITAKIGPSTNEVSGTSNEITVYDPTKAKTISLTAKRPITGSVDAVPFALNADDAKNVATFESKDNVYNFTTTVVPAGAKANTAAGYDLIKWTTTTPKVAKIIAPEVWKTGETGLPAADYVGKPKSNVWGIEFLKAGTAKVTVKVDDVSRTLTFVVTNKAATAVASIADFSMVKGQYRQVKPAMIPAEAPGKYTFKSSKTKYATINKTTGLIKAVANGTTTITVTDSISKHKATFKVTVGTDYSKISYRGFALFSDPDNIYDEGPESFTAPLTVGLDALTVVAAMELATYDGVNLATAVDAAIAENTSWEWIKGKLTEVGKAYDATTQKGVKEDDVFTFYFNGNVDSSGNILLKKDGATQTTLKMEDLFTELAKIPGTVFLVMDCNMSSQALTTKGAADLTPAQFNKMVINTAAKKSLQAKTIGTAATTAGSYKQKFKVLVSTSKKSETSNMTTITLPTGILAEEMPGLSVTVYSRWFSQYLANGINPLTIGYMPADANKNRVVTLKELYNYVNKNVKAEVTKYNKGKSSSEKVKQVVSVYPSKGDSFPVYARLLKDK